MIFTPPSWLPAIEQDLSKVGTVGDFALQGTLGNASGPRVDEPTFISASTQKERTPAQIAQNVEALAAGLAHELQWSPNAPAQGGKVVAILSENTVDYLVYCWAVHRLRGTCLLLHGTTSPQENAKHLQRSDCRTLIVSPALLQSGRAAAAAASTSEAGIRVYLTERVATDSAQVNVNGNSDTDLKTIEELVSFGKTLSPLPALDWSPEEAQSSIAYLCATSGTSGVQRLARLSHRGIILNILQVSALESTIRHRDVEIVLGVLPLSHVQGVIASHGTVYLRDRLILHTTFDMKAAMMSIQTYRINRLYLVPSVLAALVGNQFLFKIFDLSSVDTVYVGAGSLSSELYAKTKAVQPNWNLVNGYGLTESSMVVAMSSSQEPGPGPVGILLPLYQARLRREDGSDVEAFDEPGELLLSSPNQASGYIGDEEAATATFRDGWLHTGDVAIFRQSPRGDSHLYIVDRLRDMIKVKGMQVSPVAIEECLRQHPGVADVAVIGVPDNVAGERAKAFVVPMKNPDPTAKPADPETLFEQWDEHVQSKLTEPHWLRGRYELLEALPRNTSGKVAKGLLRAM
ncbi:hypothetical protein PFICI_00142 [Pestalotiopsis fici W106-1]|uniref:AMP-dependent synthetase/ligase domain-containing protein n=1 Tax=Pestalotiopsis fici (strain W106-1 / CGMCC3.15140) TaxID=1229662 RepID=W3XJW5_PESFW|nr:uncharacterized protein PFICI_00142 [Pestalotiopsis fici W106-1]ETS86314.1 hypothetical protein PFICI_00142 [Pestalotiopsis fici W106-1]